MRMTQYKPFQYGSGYGAGTKTEAQADKLLGYIKAYVAETGGVPPSYLEMAVFIGAASKSQVHRAIKRLENDGRIRRMSGRARALEVVKREAYLVWDDEAKELVPLRRRP